VPGLERPGANVLQVLGLGDVALPAVTIESALQVPAVWAAVSFLSRTLAALPLHAYRSSKAGPERVGGRLETIVHEAPNPEWTSFGLRQWFWQQVFTGGRGLLWIERNGSQPVGLWPIDPSRATISRDAKGRTSYKVDGAADAYASSEVIDIPFMLRRDGIKHFGPIAQGSKAIQLALAMNDYGSKFFAGGGVPPLAMVGPLPAGPEAMKRALSDVHRSIEAAKSSDKPLFPIPPGYDLKAVGFDPEKGQMTDARRFQVEEIARILGLPPVFLQDLTHGTLSNVEQQDLHLVKHLIGQWAKGFEQQLNLKMFGQFNSHRYVEHNLDGLLRGDFKARMEGLARAVQTAILTPDEARALENRPSAEGGDKLYMQGATVPLGTQPTNDGGPADEG
jgi:HK97 family phage portal protein